MSIASAPVAVIDSKVLRSALGTFPTGVAVVTARAPDGQEMSDYFRETWHLERSSLASGPA